MASESEYALMAGAVYISTRAKINQLSAPNGWEKVTIPQDSYVSDPDSGFEAIAFYNTANPNEIVIAYAGTDPSDITGDWLANGGLATGAGSDQLVQASEYYLAVKAANPDATITLTGHSLGGGLAALVGVFFDVEAHTFDQAPFARSAQDSALFPSSVAQDLRDDLAAQVDQNGNPVYSPEDLAALDQYLALRDANGGIPNTSRVTNIRVDGEFVQGIPLDQFSTIGSTRVIPHGPYSDPSIDMHSAALLTAFLQSEATSPEQRLNQVSTIHTDLLPMLFDSDLYAHSSRSNDKNFLDRLVRQEAGGTLPSNGEVIQDTDMVTRFNADLWTLAPAGGMTRSDGDPADAGQNNVNQSLIAFAMQKYYEEPTTGTDPLSPLFTALTGAAGSNGVRFDMADVSPQFAQAIAAGQKLDLQQAKGYALYFQQYLTQGDGLDPATEFFTDAERSYIVSFLPHMRDWYVQAGADGMTATDTLNRGAFMLGGTGADNLTGGTAADLLVGNAGEDVLTGGGGSDALIGGAANDTLSGGTGNDMLLGGAGLDTYLYNAGDNLDTIIDEDNEGLIKIDGLFANGGAQYGDARVYRDTLGRLYVKMDNDLVVDNHILIKNHQPDTFGIALTDPVPAPFFTPTTTNTIEVTGTTASDTAANDLIQSQNGSAGVTVQRANGGDDLVLFGDGDDQLISYWGVSGRVVASGGAGRDYLGGGLDKDLLEGGAGADGLYGGPQDDRLYGDAKGDTQTLIAQGATQAGNGQQGEWFDGEEGNDQIFGGAGSDLVAGGAGDDLIVTGGGDDFVWGDLNTYDSPFDNSSWKDWQVTERVETDPQGVQIIYHDISGVVIESVDGVGDDVVYAGAGNDVVRAGNGDDVLFGESGEDLIFGETGDDVLSGGSEDDFLSGGEGSDTLFGEAGSDHLQGDNGDDRLIGGSGGDYLYGLDGSDVLEGGSGADLIDGGAGDDVYIINRGDGEDHIQDSNGNGIAVGDKNGKIIFGPGITAQDIILRTGSLMLDLGNGDEVHIYNFNQNDVFAGSAVSTFAFDDGTVLTMNQLLERGFDIDGTAGNDLLFGTNTTDRISGYAGDDVLQGGDGDDRLAGGEGNDVLFGDAGADYLAGGTGDDGYDVDNTGDVIVENAGEGLDFVQSSVSYTLSAHVEDLALIGTAAINGTGNALDNYLYGNALANTLDGGEGADVLAGEAGDDIYVVDNTGDVVSENADEGIDIVQSGVTHTLAANVENLTLTGTDAIFGTGNALDNILIGNSANNGLNGGAGADAMRGGAGDDVYSVDHAGDIVTENPDEGVDLVASYLENYALPDHVENLLLYGMNGTGNALDNSIYGNGAANIIDGGAGNDDIDGSSGADTMIGGLGNDRYVVDNTGDIIVENAGEGIDSVTAEFDYTLADNIENLTLTVNGVVGTGNDLDNTLIGNSRGNTLNGRAGNDFLDGGLGIDNLRGGIGDDTYIVDNTGDYVAEASNEGTDSVRSNVTYTLSSNVENLTLTGTSAINGTGNTLDNVLIGNSAHTILNGGAGADIMLGGAGDDLYYVDNAGDLVAENLNEGRDQVLSSISFALGEHVEDLGLTGTAAINGTGNDLDNVIWGNSASNTLAGGGGSDILDEGGGADTMLGGAGDDFYLVSNSASIIIENANEGTDTVQSGITHTLTANVENLLLTDAADINGTGNALNNHITGNVASNTLIGNAGNDFLDGYFGNDLLDGGPGSDTYVFGLDYGLDIINAYDGGTDKIDVINILDVTPAEIAVSRSNADLILTISATGDMLTAQNYFADDGAGGFQIEQIRFANETVWDERTIESMTLNTIGTSGADNLYGNSTDNILSGLAGNDALYGMAGNDFLDGGPDHDMLDGGVGADNLVGGTGNDTYVVDNTGDVVTESTNSGTDTVQSGITHTLTANVENLTLTGTSAINGTGNTLNNLITGNSAANTLSGASGADTMRGGLGDDTYVVDNTGDVVTENTNEGTDTVLSGVTHTLAVNVENLTLTGTSAINGTGNTLNNLITGNSAANTLSGGSGNDTLDGAAGADSLMGGTGNDTYVVDSTGDVVTESTNSGTDTVQSGITHTLAANVENLTLTGTSAINGTGNTLNNLITGNSAANTLSGASGADTMRGGLGDDTYVVDNTGDVVTENTNEGTDTVLSGVTHTLAVNVENLTLTGTSAINGTGNTLNNLITGNSAANTLSGGSGNDLLEGGMGNDTLTDTAGTTYFNGGTGNDTLTGGTSAELYIGGQGNDVINTSSGADIIVFNQGDGTDTINGGIGTDNAISLGGGIRYVDLSLSKSDNDLILALEGDDSLTLKEWYNTSANNKTVNTLQVVVSANADYAPGGTDPLMNDAVEQFNFSDLVAQFDQELAANPSLTSWAVMQALSDYQLSTGSGDGAALGGDLAYYYGQTGQLTGVSATAAQDVIGGAGFGSGNQALRPLPSISGGPTTLS